jgi:hypothetical protein
MSTTITPVDDMQTSIGSDPDIERIYDNVQATMPAITLPLIKIALWNTIEEFAIRSTYFRDPKVYWTMGIGVSSVSFNPYSADMLVCWVTEQNGLPQWRVDAPSTLIDLMDPTAVRTGWATLVLKPVSLDSNIPSELWSTWFETVLDGTLFRLYGLPAKPWSSPQLAQYHGTRFRMGMNRARDISNRANSNQQGSWSFPYFGKGRRKN